MEEKDKPDPVEELEVVNAHLRKHFGTPQVCGCKKPSNAMFNIQLGNHLSAPPFVALLAGRPMDVVAIICSNCASIKLFSREKIFGKEEECPPDSEPS